MQANEKDEVKGKRRSGRREGRTGKDGLER